MPVYEYKCTQCKEEFEVNQRIADAPLTTCTSCGGELKKLITKTSFVLKGSGWYVTDYPSAERKKAMKSEKPADKQKAEKSGEKTEKKAEKKTEVSHKKETAETK
jgi:putative FmdB family regulatory protein